MATFITKTIQWDLETVPLIGNATDTIMTVDQYQADGYKIDHVLPTSKSATKEQYRIFLQKETP